MTSNQIGVLDLIMRAHGGDVPNTAGDVAPAALRQLATSASSYVGCYSRRTIVGTLGSLARAGLIVWCGQIVRPTSAGFAAWELEQGTGRI